MMPPPSPPELHITDLAALIRDVPDYPKPGIVFKDITPLLADPAGLSLAVEHLAQPFRHMNIDKVVGAESRGFIFGTAIAQSLCAGFVPIRKPGKLPCDTIAEQYELEYGIDEMQIHKDAVAPGERVLLVDDLLATGGTAAACCKLLATLDANIAGIAFLIELSFLKGRDKIGAYPIHALLRYDD